jgi:hypothetical protein
METTKSARLALRQAITPAVDRIWKEGQSVPLHTQPFNPIAEGEVFYQRIQDLKPSDDTQRGLHAGLFWLLTS